MSNKIVYLGDSIKIANQPLAGIAKQYIEGDIWIESHLTFEIQGCTHHMLVVIESEKRSLRFGEVGKVKTNGVTVNRDVPMLIDVAKQVQLRKQVFPWVCSVIRLKQFDDMFCSCGYSRRVLHKLLTIPNGVVVKDRKLRSFGVRTLGLGEPPNRLIQGGAEAVKQIPQNERDLVRRVLDPDPNLVPATLAIFLSEKSYGFRFAETVETVPQSVKVYLRPGCLQIGFSQGRL